MASNGLRRRRNTGDSKNNANTMTADEYATQNDLFGIISGALLVDPVRIQGDDTPGAYERTAITRWINQSGTSPTNSNKRVTLAYLQPAHDKQKEIREFVKKYPNAQIVKDWLQEQPPWYTQAIQRIRNTGAPVVQAMSRAIERVQQQEDVNTCLRCCEAIGGSGSGALVGAGIGACAGCACAMGLSGELGVTTLEQKAALGAAATTTGAAGGAVVGAVLGPERCVECAVTYGLSGGIGAAARGQGLVGGKRKRKTKKSKRKKKRKTRKSKHKHKKTIKKKRKRKRKGTKRRKKH